MTDRVSKAFPLASPFGPVNEPGMDLRDWFAGMALIGAYRVINEPEPCAINCYEMADAMMAARQAEKEPPTP